MKYYPPVFEGNAYSCPHCNAYASQYFAQMWAWSSQQPTKIEGLFINACEHCKSKSIWINRELIWPDKAPAPMPHDEMPNDCKVDFLEARSIMTRSPRGAAALLRLVVQKLMPYIGGKGKNIDDDIAALVKQGLPPAVQQALDACRVIGNEAVHPGEMNISDDADVVVQLCDLVNFIVDTQIAQPKRIEKMFGSLPTKKLEAIKRRDAK